MPKRVFPTAEEFAEFEKELLVRGFRRTTRQEFLDDQRRLGLVAPSPRKGMELGYIYTTRHGYNALVWTSYLPREGAFREKDAGRVLIRDGDVPLYHATRTHRTKNFLDNLLIRAKFARVRVKNRPPCPRCGALMNIVHGSALGSCHWGCDKSAHPGRVSRSWDYGLPPEALAIQRPIRKKRAKYYAKLRAEGKKPHVGLLSHKGWKMTRPENIVRSRR